MNVPHIVRGAQSFVVDVKKIPRRELQPNRLVKYRRSHPHLTTINRTTIHRPNTINPASGNLITSRKKSSSPGLPDVPNDYPRNGFKSTTGLIKNSGTIIKFPCNQSLEKQSKPAVPIPLDTRQDDHRLSTSFHSRTQLPFNIHQIKTNNIVHPSDDCQSLQQSGVNNWLNNITIDPLFNRTILGREDSREKERRKRRCFGWYCCPLCLFGVVLFGTALAALLLAFLIKPTTTNITTTTVTTVMTTTAVTTTVTTTTETTTMTTTTETTTMTTTTETTTTNTPLTSSLLSTNETIFAIWNTTAGSDSSASIAGDGVGNYYYTEGPNYVCDNNSTTKYTNFGYCNSSSSSYRQCGQDTGFYVIPQQGATLIRSIRFCTGNDQPPRDPLTVTIEGSNQTSALTLGTSWNLIFNGSTGLATNPGRKACGVTQYFPSNSVAYLSYRILITSQRSFDEAVQYSEVLLG